MADVIDPGDVIVNVRLSASIQNVRAGDVPLITSLVHDILAPWGEIDVRTTTSTPRKRVTFADIQQNRL